MRQTLKAQWNGILINWRRAEQVEKKRSVDIILCVYFSFFHSGRGLSFFGRECDEKKSPKSTMDVNDEKESIVTHRDASSDDATMEIILKSVTIMYIFRFFIFSAGKKTV